MSSKSTKVPLGQKVAFGVGMFANQMFPAILGIFMVVLVQDLKFSGLMWGMIYLFPRLFDAISDPIMGFISDNTKSKWGRRRQYVLVGGVLMGVAYIFMWQLFKENTVQYNFWYFFIWSIVFYLGLTFFSVPYVAMGYEMSDDFHERTSIMAIAQWIGQWAWVIAPWFWVIMYDPEWFPSADVAVRELAVWVAIPCAICAIVPAIFIKSKSTIDEDYEPLSLGNIKGSLNKIFGSFVEAFRIKEFRKLCISTFLIYNAFMAVSSLTLFVIVYKLFNGDTEASGIWVSLFGCLGALGTTFIVIPIVAWLSKKMGKKKAFMLCQAISIIGYAMLYFLFVPGKPWMYIIALPFFSFGIGSLFTIMMSMTADVIDIDELNSGKRREGIFGAIYWWMVKVGFAIAGALGGVIIWLVGFQAGVPTTEQPEAINGLHLFFCFFPVLGTIGAMWVMKDYDVSEERSNEIRAELNKRKNKTEAKPVNNYYQKGKLLSLTDIQLDNPTSILDFSNKSDKEIKASYAASLNNGMHGVSFSPYLEGQNIGDILSEYEISKRMDIILPYTKWVRSFSCTEGNEFIPKVAKQKGLKTLVGAWIDSDKEKNEKEIENLIALAKQGYVDVVAVGNEVLLREELREEEVIAYINRVKEALPEIEVGYVDTYYQFYQRPNLVEACDVLLANCYPFWEGDNIKDAAINLRKMHALMKQISKGKRIIITETGWPTEGSDVDNAKPSITNAAAYFVNANTWSHEENIELFYFSSFDESWKIRHEGDVGARWGVWDKDNQLKIK